MFTGGAENGFSLSPLTRSVPGSDVELWLNQGTEFHTTVSVFRAGHTHAAHLKQLHIQSPADTGSVPGPGSPSGSVLDVQLCVKHTRHVRTFTSVSAGESG